MSDTEQFSSYQLFSMPDSSSGGSSIISLLIPLLVYVYFAYALMTLAKKTNTANGWMAWIPVLNAYLMIKIAGKPGWWLLLLLVPIVNIVIAVIVWMKIAEAVKKPNWLGVLILVPIVNFFIPGYLAFSNNSTPVKS